MIIYFKIIFFGFVQGLTEFLPVSSSGHLALLHYFLELPVENEIAFDVFLHLATLLAVLVVLRKDVWFLLSSFLRSFRQGANEGARLAWLIILSTLPAVFAGFFLEDLIKSSFRSPYIIAFMLAVVGAVFIIAERFSKKTEDLPSLNWIKALVIGLSQAIALIPGTSRSGITIIAGLFSGLKREAAVRYSFLLSVPVILGAFLKESPVIFSAEQAGGEWSLVFAGFLAAFFSALLAVKYFLKLAASVSLNVFAYYRFVLAAVLFFILWF